MKRKFLPILVLIPLFLVSCSVFSNLKANQPLTDAEMATRVAELLSTMTTPTSEIVFPPTPTLGPIEVSPTNTPVVLVVNSPTPTTEMGGEEDAEETPADQPMLEITPTPSGQTATPEPQDLPDSDPLKTLGNPTGSDPMDSNSKWVWPSGSDDYTDIQFKDGYMLMTNVSELAGGWRLPSISQQVNTYIELTANSASCSEKDSYGIIFRVPVFNEPDQGYLYQVRCDGYYRLWKWDGKAGDKGLVTTLIYWKKSSAINAGQNQVNRLGVLAKDNKFTVYVNGVELGSISDSSFPSGFFGAFVRSGGTTDYTAKFDEMKYWQNP